MKGVYVKDIRCNSWNKTLEKGKRRSWKPSWEKY